MNSTRDVMNRAPHIHVLTPGDHFSPLTGSAVPTVVDGLAAGRPTAPRAKVVVTRGTYTERYDSADAVEYDAPRRRRSDAYVDALLGRLGRSRVRVQGVLRASVEDQAGWPEGVVLGHNLPQLVPLVDTRRHAAVLYAHNYLLRSYTPGEAKRTLGGAAAIVAVSSSLAEQLRPHLSRDLADRVRVVLNGVDCRRFRPDLARERGDVLDVVLIGRMIRDKGPDVLLEAVRRLGRRDIRVTLVGSAGFDPKASLSRYEQSLRREADGVAGQVRFVPFVPRAELASLLRGADVLVVPSRWPDPCPLTVMEGMASGLAVVASRIGGIPEAIGNGGLLVAPDDPDGLAEALGSLADDDSLRAGLGARGRAHALAHDWAWAARNLDEALSSLT